MQDKARSSGFIAVDYEFLTTFLSSKSIQQLTRTGHIKLRRYKVVKVRKSDAHTTGDYIIGAITGGLYHKASKAAAAKARNAAASAVKTARKAGKGVRAQRALVSAGKVAGKAARVGGFVASWTAGGLLETAYDDITNNDNTLEFAPLDDPREAYKGMTVVLYEIDETGSLGSPVSFSSVAFAANDSNYSNFKDKVTITGGNLTTNSYYLIDAYAYAPAMTLTVGPEDFAGSYYIEADTLFREESTGDDKPAQFVIPHGKVQSQYTFSMAATGDPSTFTFTVDAFPDYVNFDRSRKVLFALNILG
jgi:hypothetical protein